jgi:hypothetical protein
MTDEQGPGPLTLAAHRCRAETREAQRDHLALAAKTALDALADKRIGTPEQDSPDWYNKVELAVVQLRAALEYLDPADEA